MSLLMLFFVGSGEPTLLPGLDRRGEFLSWLILSVLAKSFLGETPSYMAGAIIRIFFPEEFLTLDTTRVGVNRRFLAVDFSTVGVVVTASFWITFLGVLELVFFGTWFTFFLLLCTTDMTLLESVQESWAVRPGLGPKLDLLSGASAVSMKGMDGAVLVSDTGDTLLLMK